MDDSISLIATWILGIMCCAPVLAAGIIAVWRENTRTLKDGEHNIDIARHCNYRPWPWRLHVIITMISASAWLWSPWAALALVTTYRANWNAVNYVNRPDTVTPVPGKVYRADEKPVETP